MWVYMGDQSSWLTTQQLYVTPGCLEIEFTSRFSHTSDNYCVFVTVCFTELECPLRGVTKCPTRTHVL